MGSKGREVRSRVRSWVVFATSGCHFVAGAPSLAEMGNWPGWKVEGEEAGTHCAMLFLRAVVCGRFGRVRVPFGGREKV